MAFESGPNSPNQNNMSSVNATANEESEMHFWHSYAGSYQRNGYPARLLDLQIFTMLDAPGGMLSPPLSMLSSNNAKKFHALLSPSDAATT